MSQHPETIGRYRIDGVLGRGAMGVVYKGWDPVIERTVAVKLLRTELLSEEDAAAFRARFKREAQAAGRLNHPNIVAVYDFAEHEGRPFIAMEHVRGAPLERLMRQHARFGRGVALSVAGQILSALACAHAGGVVHRDVKPANIMLLDNGQVKVADFGVSRIEGSDLTHDGSVVGTPAYMAPEQFRGEAVDHRADLFSTGVVLYELIAGARPFPGKTYTEVMYRLLNDAPRELREFDPDCPPAVAAAVARALAKDPADRFPSAAAFADALRGAAAGDFATGIPPADDRTVLLPRRPAGTATGAGAPAGGLGDSDVDRLGGSGASEWDPALLASLERQLTRFVGPVAKVLVRSAASRAGTVAELRDRLAEKIPTEAERRQFTQAVAATGTALTGSSGMVRRMRGPAIPEAELDAAQRALVRYLGPIAKVLVTRAAAQARSLEDLHERLAGHLERADERAAFLKAVRAE